MAGEKPNSDRPAPALSTADAGDETFRQLIDTAPDAIVVVDGEGRIALVNKQTERMFGYDRRALIGHEVEVLIPERFRSSHVGHRRRFVASPKIRPMGSGLELFGRKRDGSEFPIEVSISPLATPQGMLVSANIRDITDRKRNELLMRRVQQHLLSAVESIQGAFAIFDAQDQLVLCNSEYRHALLSSLEREAVGRQFAELLDASLASGVFDFEDRTPAEFRAAWLAYHRDPAGALDARTPDGRSLRVVERETAEGGMVTTIWDVTEAVSREDELRHARALAEAANSAKSEFLASMSHELRTPLNAILGFAQLLHRDKKEPLSERHRERIEHVLKGGEHLLRLIDEVLDLARIEAGRVSISLEPVDVREVLAEVKTTLGPMAARAEIALVVAPVPPDVPVLTADRTRFKQVLMNYGSNAIKYGKKGGSATFLVEAREGFVRVTVEDDGLGIAQDKQDKIFQAFQRAGQETGPIEGSGIGLAISKRLSELMHGRVGFESAEGSGSQFWIELPVHTARIVPALSPSAAAKPRGEALSGSDGPKYTIVYVEDNPSSIALVQALLADFERVELLTAPTAEIGIELVRARLPSVVLMDINLPGMSGLDATRQLRDWPETRGIPVIALSAAAMVRDSAKVTDAGFYRFLTKPVKIDQLAGVLEELLVPPSNTQ
jgi:PAS domain S-box-containing protein